MPQLSPMWWVFFPMIVVMVVLLWNMHFQCLGVDLDSGWEGVFDDNKIKSW